MQRGNQLSRVTAILELMAESRNPMGLSALEIHAHLKKKRFRCHIKTVRRDLSWLESHSYVSSSLPTDPGGPIRYRKNISSSRAAIERSLTNDEVMALLVAQAQMRLILSRRIQKGFDGILEMLDRTLGSPFKQKMSELGRVIKIYGEPQILNRDIHPAFFNSLLEACLKGENVEFDYLRAGADAPQKETVSPAFITLHDKSMYLTAAKQNQPFRNFAIVRMSNVKISRKTKRYETKQIAKQCQSLFGLQNENGPVVSVKLLFSPNLSGYISERKWPGETINVKESWYDNPNGRRLELDVKITKDLKRWVLGWGTEIKVLAPIELQMYISHTCAELAKTYSAI